MGTVKQHKHWHRHMHTHVCVYACVCAYVCVASQSPLFHKVYCYLLSAWVSELCGSSSNRHLSAFNMSILLTNTTSDEVNLSSTLSQERLTCMLFMLVLVVHLRSSHAALFWANFPKSSLWHLTSRLNSSPGAPKLESVGSALLIVLRRQSIALL